MDTRYIRLGRRWQFGAVRPIALAIVAVFVLLALGAWLLILRPHRELMLADAGRLPGGATVASGGEPALADVQSMSLNQLLAEARKAMNEQRLLAPAGNNAFEYYLRALQKQPGNQVAADALRETFPFGATAAEQSINQRDFIEAQRQIELLARADPSNYTLTILRSKLDAQRKLLDREQQQALDQQKQQQLAAKQLEVARQADAVAAKQRSEQAAQPVTPPAVATRAAPLAASAPTKLTASVRPAEGGHTEPVLLEQATPRYPPYAMRSGQEGWVELQFTVDSTGSVQDVVVLNSQPRHVFDHAAIEAVSRWKFQPASEDGVARAATLMRRIQFKLSQ
ncbi:MAG: energy transducer TonB [Dyella sp.]